MTPERIAEIKALLSYVDEKYSVTDKSGRFYEAAPGIVRELLEEVVTVCHALEAAEARADAEKASHMKTLRHCKFEFDRAEDLEIKVRWLAKELALTRQSEFETADNGDSPDFKPETWLERAEAEAAKQKEGGE